MEKNKKTTTTSSTKTKTASVKKTVTKKPRKVSDKKNCCSVPSGKKKCAIKLIVGIIIIILIVGIFFIVRGNKKGPDTAMEKRPLSADGSMPTEVGEVVETYLLDEEVPSEAEVIVQGKFNGVEQEVKGKALFVKSDGKTYLRFEEFTSINGQDIHVYLSPILNLDKGDVIDLGLLKSVSGNFNYELEEDLNIEKYSNVIIWSNPFDAFFGYASLLNKELPAEQETEMTDEEKAQQDAENNPQMPPLDPDEENANEGVEEEQTGEAESQPEEGVDGEIEIQSSTEEPTEELSETEEVSEDDTTEESSETENTENQ